MLALVIVGYLVMWLVTSVLVTTYFANEDKLMKGESIDPQLYALGAVYGVMWPVIWPLAVIAALTWWVIRKLRDPVQVEDLVEK